MPRRTQKELNVSSASFILLTAQSKRRCSDGDEPVHGEKTLKAFTACPSVSVTGFAGSKNIHKA